MVKLKKPPRTLRHHFFKEWREYRGLTQEQAASRLEVDRTTLGRVENRKLPYSQSILEAAAEAYGCEPWDLLNVDPTKEGKVIDLLDEFRKSDPAEQKAALDFLHFQRSRQN